ncbi:hypothetical protein FQR65_LT17182 [Abscondita terminalis]|nr:hypothetical protein FQR65_LT17182 [Abscondita terminalis]
MPVLQSNADVYAKAHETACIQQLKARRANTVFSSLQTMHFAAAIRKSKPTDYAFVRDSRCAMRDSSGSHLYGIVAHFLVCFHQSEKLCSLVYTKIFINMESDDDLAIASAIFIIMATCTDSTKRALQPELKRIDGSC